MSEVLAAGIIAFATLFGALGSLYLKKGADRLSDAGIKNFALFLGLFCYGFATLMYIGSLRLGRLSVLAPITSLTYIWVSFLSIRFLGEKMNKFKWMGIFTIIIGVVLLMQ